MTNRIQTHNLLVVVAIMMVFGIYTLATAVPVQAWDKPNAAELKVLGKTIGQWSAKWWQWALSIPEGSNPIREGDCNQNQSGPVWFLAGNEGSVSDRECRVPSGKHILFPLVNALYWNDSVSEPVSVEQKRSELDFFLSLGCNLSATIDGTPSVYHNPTIRTQSPTFPIKFIENNIYGESAGWVDKKAVSDGFWVMLPPLDKGDHVIHFTGAFCDGGEPFIEVDVTYQITVLPGKQRY